MARDYDLYKKAPPASALLGDDLPGYMISWVGRVSAYIEGILADGTVNALEADALHILLQNHSEVILTHWGFPLSTLLRIVERMKNEGSWTSEKLDSLRDILRAFVEPQSEASKPCNIIFDDPQPEVLFTGKEFGITGTFVYGPRSKVMDAITDRGGIVKPKTITKNTHYLVVGTRASEDWGHGSYGGKIEQAATQRALGQRIAIITEAHWSSFL